MFNLMKLAPLSLLLVAGLAGTQAVAQDQASDDYGAAACPVNDCVLTYPRSFFDQYSPITALDVVRNTPGFQIDEGDQSRGFAGAAGNVLINGERPSAKSETASDILQRLPADAVKELQLIRGQSGGLDLRGQSVVVNVILVPGARRSVTYEVGTQTRTIDPGFFPFGSVSLSQTSDTFDFTIGAEVERGTFQATAVERVLSADGALLELRDEEFQEDGWEWKVFTNGQARLGAYKIGFNGAYSDRRRTGGEVSERLPTGDPAPFFLLQGQFEDEEELELGGDIERTFGANWTVKAIGLYRREDEIDDGDLALGPSEDEAGLVTVSDFSTLETETIGRMEVDYAGWRGHIIEISGEYASNKLDSNFALSRAETPGGDLIPVPVAGAETSIREERGDFALTDSWNMDKLVIDTTLAGEVSTISQSGDIGSSRDFSFFKPSIAASYSPSSKLQFRARAERLVGQLDFDDFASSTDLGDDEIEAGNPELSPDTRWRFSAATELRFGELGSFTLTAFHEEISNVIDVLPGDPDDPTSRSEAVGNIGDGTRTGVEFEGTLPLTALLKGARVDFNGFIQRSRVTDPVTGVRRRLSDERNWELGTSFRQDFAKSKFSWGGEIIIGSAVPFFGVDELDFIQRETDVDLFAEITRFGGLRFRLEIGNALGNGRIRERDVYTGRRGLSPIDFLERRDRTFGYRVTFSVRGNF